MVLSTTDTLCPPEVLHTFRFVSFRFVSFRFVFVGTMNMKMKKFEFWFGRENADESSQERQEETKHPLLSVDTHIHARAL